MEKSQKTIRARVPKELLAKINVPEGQLSALVRELLEQHAGQSYCPLCGTTFDGHKHQPKLETKAAKERW